MCVTDPLGVEKLASPNRVSGGAYKDVHVWYTVRGALYLVYKNLYTDYT